MKLHFLIKKRLVMKNIIVVVLIISLLLQFTGCYTPRLVSKEELVSRPTNAGLVVKTKDNVGYFYKRDSYKIINDTIIGEASLILENNARVDLDTPQQIGFNEAESIKIEKIDPVKTVLAGVAGIGLGVLLILGVKSLMKEATKSIASDVGSMLGEVFSRVYGR